MPSYRSLVTLFAQPLLHSPDPPPTYAHLSLHLPTHTLASYYRIGYDGGQSTCSFCISANRCFGYAIEELDGASWDGPRLLSWTTFAEYEAQMDEPLPTAEPWSVLLPAFLTVELITDRSIRYCSGQDLLQYTSLFHHFDASP